MHRIAIALAVALLMAPLLSLLLDAPGRPEPARVEVPISDAGGEEGVERPVPDRLPAEETIYRSAAALAWRYVEAQYHAETGLVNSVIAYPYATAWDIGSTLAAYHSAHALGLISIADFNERTARALDTLSRLELFAGVAFNKNYDIARGLPAGRSDREPAEGYGWSATDLGRLLVWLRIVATHHPRHAPAVQAVVSRLDFETLVRGGYLRGAERSADGARRDYQEGRLGYEQYAAAGFALWGHFADLALSTEENAIPVDVLGVELLRDTRPGGHLTAEPLFLMGLEFGWWTPQWEALASGILAAQEARYRQTGVLTMASEDAIPLPPYYFYYYTVHHEGEDFAVVGPVTAQPLPGPRWVSTKAAFAWYALHPSGYTGAVLDAIQAAADPRLGWSSGLFEETGEPTGSQNINTSAVILQAAAYRLLGRPLLVAR
jgi:hypothetical protein